MSQHRCNGNTACLDGQDFVHFDTTEPALQFVGYLSYDVNINLVIEKIVDLQDVTLLDVAIRKNLFFKEIHKVNRLFATFEIGSVL
jgi:hypothetical protein